MLDVRSEEARLMDQFILSINDFGSPGTGPSRSEELISHSQVRQTRLTIIFVDSDRFSRPAVEYSPAYYERFL